MEPLQAAVPGELRKRKPESHHTDLPSKMKRRQGTYSGLKLCKKCREIDFAEIHSNHSPDMDIRNGYEVCDLSYVNSGSGCALCNFLLRMQEGTIVLKSLKGHQLRAYSASKRLLDVKNRLRDMGQMNGSILSPSFITRKESIG
jgi:hypothetical protein